MPKVSPTRGTLFAMAVIWAMTALGVATDAAEEAASSQWLGAVGCLLMAGVCCIWAWSTPGGGGRR